MSVLKPPIPKAISQEVLSDDFTSPLAKLYQTWLVYPGPYETESAWEKPKTGSKIVMIKGAGAALYSRGGGMGGVIMLYLKEGDNFDYQLSGVVKYTPLGYQTPADFYVPKYEIDSVRLAKQPDMRTTIYWKPDIVLDSNGKASVRFYAADPNTTYSFVLEGVTTLGEICRYRNV